ncbi:hypothetical protein [Streptomyces halobius]|uniref:Uncharacterized protein n=1 Tax=Streptomyces halobius TaxID=2879846 RepID=A0ABY4M4B5_9ACTN|nr:hypothetical protein [Streptomyces halobius]UQA91664.1 hypothetical protein K9S39_07115 [Streptomyces halobius]
MIELTYIKAKELPSEALADKGVDFVYAQPYDDRIGCYYAHVVGEECVPG